MTKITIISALLIFSPSLHAITLALSGQLTTTRVVNTLDPTPLGTTVGDETDFTFTINLDPTAGFLGMIPAGGTYGHDVYGYSRDAIIGATLTTGSGTTLNIAPGVFVDVLPSISGEFPALVSDSDLSINTPTRWNFYIGTTPGGGIYDFEEIRVSQFGEFVGGKRLLPSTSKLTFRYAREIEGFDYDPSEDDSPTPQAIVEGDTESASLETIPEPASMFLVSLGFLVFLRRRDRSC